MTKIEISVIVPAIELSKELNKLECSADGACSPAAGTLAASLNYNQKAKMIFGERILKSLLQFEDGEEGSVADSDVEVLDDDSDPDGIGEEENDGIVWTIFIWKI